MCGEPWDSWVEAQCLAGCIRAGMWGASLGLGAEQYCETHGPVVLSCKLLMTLVAVVLLSLQQGSRD